MKRTRQEIFDFRGAQFRAIFKEVQAAITPLMEKEDFAEIPLFLALAANMQSYIAALQEGSSLPLPDSLKRLKDALGKAIIDGVAAQAAIDLNTLFLLRRDKRNSGIKQSGIPK